MSTVLIADAQTGDAALLASALRVEGFDVVLVSSRAEAAAVFVRTPVLIAVVDLTLRDENGAHGLEFAREVRERSPATRVLLTSTYHLSERQLARADTGISAFIPKPYDVAEVVSFIRAKAFGPPSSRGSWRSSDAPKTPDPATVRARTRDDSIERARR